MSSDQPIVNTNIASPASDKSESTPPVSNTVRFNMEKLSSSSNIITSTVNINKKQINDNKNSCSIIGPMLDDGAPYSAIGIEELRSLHLSILPTWDGSLESIPEIIADRAFWQYGVGAHESAARRILGSVILDVNIPGGYTIQLRHLVLDDSSNCVIGRNITKHSNIIHMNENVLQIPYGNGKTVSIPLVDHDVHSYLQFYMFSNNFENIMEKDPSKKYSAIPVNKESSAMAAITASNQSDILRNKSKNEIINSSTAEMAWKDIKKNWGQST